jgi:hypothetical protein
VHGETKDNHTHFNPLHTNEIFCLKELALLVLTYVVFDKIHERNILKSFNSKAYYSVLFYKESCTLPLQ